MSEFDAIFRRISCNFLKEFHVFTDFNENVFQLLRKFHSFFEKILLKFKENFTQF